VLRLSHLFNISVVPEIKGAYTAYYSV